MTRAEAGLRLACQFLRDSSYTYRTADQRTQRRCHQAFFKQLFVGPDERVANELTDEFSELLDDDLPAKVAKLPTTAALFTHGVRT